MKARRTPSLVVCLALVASAARAQAVWTVDPAGGAGADFENLQTAIDAVGEGDILVLRAGFHTSGLFVLDPPCFGCLTIDGKSLTLVAEEGAAVQLAATTVRNLGPSQSVTLRGFETVDRTLRIENDLGPVWLEDLDLSWTLAPFAVGTPLAITGSSAVHVNRCTVLGGAFGGHSALPGSHAISASNSSLYFYDTIALGGSGSLGAPAGSGVAFSGGGVLFASGSTFGPGPGVSLSSGSPAAYTLDTAAAFQGGAGSHTDFPGVARHLQVSSPVRVGETATIELRGVPFDIPILDFSTRPGASFQTLYKGTYQLGTPPIVSLVLAPLPPPGKLDLPFQIESFGPSFQGVTLYVQADFVSLPGELTMGPGSAMTILAR